MTIIFIGYQAKTLITNNLVFPLAFLKAYQNRIIISNLQFWNPRLRKINQNLEARNLDFDKVGSNPVAPVQTIATFFHKAGDFSL
jgi:hypothetical protein